MTVKPDNTTRIRLIEDRIAQLEGQLAGALRSEARGGQEHKLRIGKTATDSTYPTPPANTYDVILEEWDYTATPGDQTPTVDPLSATPMVVAHDPVPGRFLAEGEQCLVLEQPNRRRLLWPLVAGVYIARVAESSGLPPRKVLDIPAAGTITLYKTDTSTNELVSLGQVEAINVGNTYLLSGEFCRAGHDAAGNWTCWPLPTFRRTRPARINYTAEALGSLKFFTSSDYGSTDDKWPIYVDPTGGSAGQPAMVNGGGHSGAPMGMLHLWVSVQGPASPAAASAGQVYCETIQLWVTFGAGGYVSLPFYYGETNLGHPTLQTACCSIHSSFAPFAALLELHEFNSTLVNNSIGDYTLVGAVLSYVPGGPGSGVGSEP